MRTGRPRNPSTQFKVGVHRNGGAVYATTQPMGEDGRRRYLCWGTLEEPTKTFIPGPRFYSTRKSERDKLIFPPDWDLRRIREVEDVQKDGLHISREPHVSRFVGATLFMREVAKATQVWEDLVTALGSADRAEMALTLAVYPEMCDMCYNAVETWQRKYKTFTEIPLTSQTIYDFSVSITDAEREKFLSLRGERERQAKLEAAKRGDAPEARIVQDSGTQHRNPEVLMDTYLCVDSTSVSSYSRNLVSVRYGKNKEKLPLPQTLEVVVYSLLTHLPVYYMEMQGNMSDSRTMPYIIKRLKKAGFEDMILVTDRAYDNVETLETAIKEGIPLLTAASVARDDLRAKIRLVGGPSSAMTSMTPMEEGSLYCRQWLEPPYKVRDGKGREYGTDTYRINLYFDPGRWIVERHALDVLAKGQLAEAAGMVGKQHDEAGRMALAENYPLVAFNWTDDGVLVSCEKNTAEILEREIEAGFFASKTVFLDITPETAHRNYNFRDEQEKAIKRRKRNNATYRHRASEELSHRGRLFFTFVGLILNSYIMNVKARSEFLNKTFDSVQSIQNEMSCIKIDEYSGEDYIIAPFVGLQVNIYQEFGFSIPEGCAPGYKSQKVTPPKKRGRPRKDSKK